MPGPHRLDAAARALVTRQYGVLTISQALSGGLSPRSLRRRVATGAWVRVLPGVLLTTGVGLTREQRLVAVHLWSGGIGLVDGLDACAAYGLRELGSDRDRVRIVLPRDTTLRSEGFVVVRRSRARLARIRLDDSGVEYVAPAHAAVVGAATLPQLADARALLARAVQRRRVSTDALARALRTDPPYRRRRVITALEGVLGGARSEGEARFRALAQRSPLLPPLVYNALLRLPDGRLVSPDALCLDAALVHETDGWSVHAADPESFDATYDRRDALTAAGFTVLSSTPRQLRDSGPAVIRRFEQVYLRQRESGLPPGVELVRVRPSDAPLVAAPHN